MNKGKVLSRSVIQLMEKGLKMTDPFSVEVGDEVSPDRISGREVLFYGSVRILGKKTVIGPGARLGFEGPVTVQNCVIGPQAELKGGFFRSSVFLDKASLSAGAHVREGCILEEEATVGHTVGLKQTILFPFVTLGSLINFCDCLMAGGTSRKNHSEVGSSYVHFNYTPQGDKATPSLVGDVAGGVMLDRAPIFLGGQGGLIGPARIGYGTVIPAGIVHRGDAPEGGKLLAGVGRKLRDQNFYPGLYGDIRAKVYNNIIFAANLLALRQWYIHVRGPFLRRGELGDGMYAGALETLELGIGERRSRLRELSLKMEESLRLGAGVMKGNRGARTLGWQREFREGWPAAEAALNEAGEAKVALKDRDVLLGAVQKEAAGVDYISAMRGLSVSASSRGRRWLEKIIGHAAGQVLAHLPSFQP